MSSLTRLGVASRVFALVAAVAAGSPGCGGAAVHASTASASPTSASAQPSVSLGEVLGPEGATRTTAQLAEVARLFRTIERDAAAWYRANGGATLQGRQSINARLLRVSGKGQVECYHDRIREAAVQRLLPVEKRALHAALAEALDA